MAGLTESVVEDPALAWLESLGYGIKHGPEIAAEIRGLFVNLDMGSVC